MAQVDTSTNNSGELAQQYIAALGELDNLQEVDACITRLRITVKDTALINEVKLKELGAMGVVNLGENKLQVILGPKADCVAQQIKTLKQS